jgi:hypothetical protein
VQPVYVTAEGVDSGVMEDYAFGASRRAVEERLEDVRGGSGDDVAVNGELAGLLRTVVGADGQSSGKI